MIWLLPILGALLSRWHGSELPPRKVFKSLAWAIPFAIAVWFLSGAHEIEVRIALTALTLGLCALGKSTSHGGFMDLASWDKPRENERLEVLIKGLHGVIPEFWYDALGLAIVGIAAVYGAAIAFLFINPMFSGIIVMSGCLKSAAYIIGYLAYRRKFTVVGEFLTGFFAYGGLALCLAY